MMDAERIRPDLMVHARGPGAMGGAEGVHVGTVDDVEDARWIQLARKDSPDGKHHWIPREWVDRVDDKAVYLNKSADDVRRGWSDSPPPTLY